MIIYIAFPLAPAGRILLNNVKGNDEWYWSQDLDEKEQLACFKKATVVFGNVPATWLSQTAALKWMQLYSAGFDPYLGLDWEGTLQHVRVTNLRGFFGQPVAETVVAGILAQYRKIDELVRLKEKRIWKGAALRPDMQMLFRKKVLILGSGAIGQTTRSLLEAFSCDVTMVGRSKHPTLSDLDNLLPQADIVIAALPDTAETKGLFGKERLALMRPGSLFVNVGRGGVVIEEALIAALQQQRPAGAILDVSNDEPLPEHSPLWKEPNILLTQHTGGGYEEEEADKVRVFIDNLHRFRSEEPLLNVVDFSKGY